MDGVTTLFSKMKKDPKKVPAVVDKMIDKLDIEGTEELDVPEDVAFLFEEFDKYQEGDELSSKLKEFFKKPPTLKQMKKMVTGDGKKKHVKVNLSKVKSIMKKDSKKLKDGDTQVESKNESVDDFSLLQPYNEVVAESSIMLGAMALVPMFYALTFAYVILFWWVFITAIINGEADLFAEKGESTAGTIFGTVFVYFLGWGIVYTILMYLKLKKKGIIGKKKSTNESVEDDSIIAMMLESDSSVTANPATCFDKSHEMDHNGNLLAAYRTVINDLTSRVGKA